MKIVSNPQHVCFEHAVEFWTGLLANAVFPLEPCVKQESARAAGESRLSPSPVRRREILSVFRFPRAS